MAEPARSFEQPHERTTKLHELGLDERTLETAVIRGYVARQSCTAFDPPSFPGTVQWAQSHRALRELLAERDWTPDDTRNYSRVIRSDRAVAVTVSTGDEQTAVRGPHEPSTKYPKGAQTAIAVETNVNIGQLSLWESASPQIPAAESEAEPRQQVLWVLLIATVGHEVRYELSRPDGQDEHGRVVSWSERIIFDSIDTEALVGRQDDDDGGDAGLDVPVERI